MSDTMLKAAQMAFPMYRWGIHGRTGALVQADSDGNIISQIDFNPRDPTKGDLAALLSIIMREGWKIGFDEHDTVLEKSQYYAWRITEGYIYGDTLPELALNVVEQMP